MPLLVETHSDAVMPVPVPAPSDAGAAVEFWKIAVPAGAGLLGVLVGGAIQLASAYLSTGLQRKHRLSDEADARKRAAAEEAAERDFVRALLALHLEGFARKCAEVMWDNDDSNPDREHDGAAVPPDFPKWPAVAWELLGADEMVRVRDIEVRVSILRDQTEGAVRYGAGHVGEARDYYAEGAATIGLEALNLAGALRAQASVEPFRFPEGGANYAEALKEYLDRIAEREREAEARREARRAATGEAADLKI